MKPIVTAIAFTLILSGCGKPAPTDAPPAPAPPAAAPAPTEAPTAAQEPALVTAYEALRVALVNDDLEATHAAGAALAAAAADHAAIAAAAKDVHVAADLEVARLAFGEASRGYITHLAAGPALAAGKHAFRCPMAKGYTKWVQLNGEIDNPYMGQRMLKCGGPVDLEP